MIKFSFVKFLCIFVYCSLLYVRSLETEMSEFLDVDDTIVFGMGFATNSMNIPALVDEKCLILSDSKNHSSIVLGCRLSNAVIRPFKHNDMFHLESQVRHAIFTGNPKRYGRPFKKILIVVEGIYSMEGTIANLSEIIRIKKKYGCYVYLDEAHSIGAIGKTGRGVCEYHKVKHSDVDVLMGTFTKSFGAAGGYIAGNWKTINHLRNHSHGNCYANSMTAPVAAQALQALRLISSTRNGLERVTKLKENTKYFRKRLVEEKFLVYGDDHSPVVPMITCEIDKMIWLHRECLKRGVAIVIVAFPATPLSEGRCRFCLSSSHTKEDLDKVLEIIFELGKEVRVDYLR